MTPKQHYSKSTEWSDYIAANLNDILDHYGVSFTGFGSHIKGICPIHDGADNPSALHINLQTRRWRCYTHQCHASYGGNLIGLILGIISSQLGRQLTLIELFNELSRLRQQGYDKPPKKFIPPAQKKTNVRFNINMTEYLQKVKLPSSYYITRGFSPEVLRRYCIGEIKTPSNQYYGQTIVPMFSSDGTKIIATALRNPNPKCIVCGAYHPANTVCPDVQARHLESKWKTLPYGFLKTHYLYNWHYASKYILQQSAVIIVEGPPNIWKLAEIGCPLGLAVLGSSIDSVQIKLIQSLNPKTIIIGSDNDNAGMLLRDSIQQAFTDRCVKTLDIQENDLSEVDNDILKDMITKCL